MDLVQAAHYEVGNMPNATYDMASPVRRTSFSKAVEVLTDKNFASRLGNLDLAMVVRQLRHDLAPISQHAFFSSVPPHTRRGTCSTQCPC